MATQKGASAPKTPEGEAEAAVAAAGEDWSKLDVVLKRGDPRKLKRQEINARFMTAQQMEQLVANVRRDGVLTSLPLCCAGADGDEILSGHHRVEAAIAAGLAEIDYLCIATPLTLERKRAIQLSHNAIAGQDDPVTLATMYADLDLDARNYSGLDDSVLKAMENVELAGLNVGIKYQDMHLYFLPEDAAVVGEVLKDLDAAARKNQAWVARYADFDAFFETAVATKLKHQAFNTGVAVGLMAQLARERLAQLEAEAAPLPNPEDADAAG